MQDHTTHSSTFAIADWTVLLALLATAFAYLWAARREGRRGVPWQQRRSISFLIGAGLLAVAFSPPFMSWAHGDINGHMAQHLLVGMFAPIFLVEGAPVLLALKSLPAAGSRVMVTAWKSSAFQLASHPATALGLNMGGMYVLYLTPLYAQSLVSPFGHHLIHIHFLVAGYLFAWSLIGHEPAKHSSFQMRAWVLFISMAAHAFLGKYMYAYSYPRHTPFSDAAIREAAKMMYYWGDLSEIILAVLLFYYAGPYSVLFRQNRLAAVRKQRPYSR